MLATAAPSRTSINNAFYDDLGDRWYEDDTHAIALLRVESRLKVEYVKEMLAKHGIGPGARVLDVACGAGFISIPLAMAGYAVRGIDLSQGSLEAAARRAPDVPHLSFATEDALHLSDADASYDAVMLLDFLEHVEDPERAVQEAARVLRPGGVMIVHTFNKTLAARLLAIKALELFSRDCPDHVHVYELFLSPKDVGAMMRRAGVGFEEVRGLRPDFFSGAFVRTVLRRRLDPGFSFRYTRSLAVGYIGTGVKG